MTTVTIALIIVSALLLLTVVGLAMSIKRNLEMADKIDELGDQVEETLDVIDGCYQRIAKVAEMPVATDDPVIQQLVSDIKYTKQALLLIANKIVTFDQEEEESE